MADHDDQKGSRPARPATPPFRGPGSAARPPLTPPAGGSAARPPFLAPRGAPRPAQQGTPWPSAGEQPRAAQATPVVPPRAVTPPIAAAPIASPAHDAGEPQAPAGNSWMAPTPVIPMPAVVPMPSIADFAADEPPAVTPPREPTPIAVESSWFDATPADAPPVGMDLEPTSALPLPTLDELMARPMPDVTPLADEGSPWDAELLPSEPRGQSGSDESMHIDNEIEAEAQSAPAAEPESTTAGPSSADAYPQSISASDVESYYSGQRAASVPRLEDRWQSEARPQEPAEPPLSEDVLPEGEPLDPVIEVTAQADESSAPAANMLADTTTHSTHGYSAYGEAAIYAPESAAEWSDANAQSARPSREHAVAAALESVAKRIRSGELTVPTASAAFGEAAAVAAALAALLSGRRGG